MKKRHKLKITIFTGIMVVLIAFSVTLAELYHDADTLNSEPVYMIPSSIQQAFRSEWVWNEALQEYDNLQGLIRDKSTGLFPEPEDSPDGLAEYATWDPRLGLYVANFIKIDYLNDTISEVQPSMDDTNRIIWPDYDIKEQNALNESYLKYQDLVMEKYYNRGLSSHAIQDLVIFKNEQFTPDWFGLYIHDLPMIVTKLEEGAPPAYTMSLITFLLRADFGVYPSIGQSYHLDDWVLAFNTAKADIKERVAADDIASLGYLVLPELYNNMKAGIIVDLPTLTEIAYGLPGFDQEVAAIWGREQWLTWFDDHANIITDLQWVLDHEIAMPWLK